MIIRTKIGTIEIDASISETHNRTATVTENPVEKGVDIVDHVLLKPTVITINGIVSDSPIEGTPEEGRALSAYKELIRVWKAREPVTVVTGLEVYTNVILHKLSTPRSAKIGNAIEFTAELQQVELVQSMSVPIPADIVRTAEKPLAQSTQDLGRQTTEEASKKVSEPASILYGTFKGLGVIPEPEGGW